MQVFHWSYAAIRGVAIAVAVLVGLAAGSLTASAKGPINTIGSPGVAIKGFDPVAYFVSGGPKKGKKEFSLSHAGVEWRFASAENKALFVANPAKYKPAYGGYCAYGVAQGYKVKIEGNAWAIRSGKLYLNYDRGIQRRWNKRPGTYVKVANKKWPRLSRR